MFIKNPIRTKWNMLNQKIDDLNRKVDDLNRKTNDLEKENTAQLFLQARLLNQLNQVNTDKILENIQLAEFKVYSQWNDDGIIQFLINYLNIKCKIFIEFGVEDYKESNTRFLLMHDNWTGLIIDGTEDNIKKVKEEEIYWKYQLTAVSAFITAENINYIISQNGLEGDIGLLHIDIDGNDYWVWKAITNISPIIAIVEYNSVFGKDKPWTIPYKADFYRTDAHYSNLYLGSSLCSLCDLAEEKGYFFVGCNSNGNNAYFIRKDHIGRLQPLDINQGYVKSKFRESRDTEGMLTYVDGDMRLQEIQGMEIFNTRTKKVEYL